MTLTLDTGATILNSGILEAGPKSTLQVDDSISGSGQLEIANLATMVLDGSDAGEHITFLGNSGSGTSAGTLTLSDVFPGAADATINASSSTKGVFTIDGAGNVDTASGDAIDFTGTGGSSFTGTSAGALTVSLTGAISGADNGIVVTQKGIGNINVSASGDVTGNDGSGIDVVIPGATTGGGNITVTAANVTGTGTDQSASMPKSITAARAMSRFKIRRATSPAVNTVYLR